MRHYGAEPPWKSEGELGRWSWVPPDPRLWIPEPGYWEWGPRRTTVEMLNNTLVSYYLPRIKEMLA
jgi:hypothetical protein